MTGVTLADPVAPTTTTQQHIQIQPQTQPTSNTTVTATDTTIVDAKANGATAAVTQDTHKGTPTDIIDQDASTKWQVKNNPDTIVVTFTLPEPARVTGDYIDIGTTRYGVHQISEYELHIRNSSSESWTKAKTFSGRVARDDSNGNADSHSFAPITASQFKLVITQHNAPWACDTECDVPLYTYNLRGEFIEPRANFQVGSLSVDSRMNKYTTATATADITNIGAQSGTQNVEFHVDGETETITPMSLTAGENDTTSVTIETGALSAGQHTLSVHTANRSYSQTFYVEGPSIVNAKANDTVVNVSTGTWRSPFNDALIGPEGMIDQDEGTKWQVGGEPDDIVITFNLSRKARVISDYIDIGGVGNGKDISEYTVYARNTTTASWQSVTTIEKSIADTSDGSVIHPLDPVTAKQYKIVITEHAAPLGCRYDDKANACDVPFVEFHLRGQYTDAITPDSPPQAAFTSDPSSTNTGETIIFDAGSSTDETNAIQSYEWDFDGDGQTDATGEAVTHSFTDAGDHEVSLTVTDTGGLSDSTTQTVSVQGGSGSDDGSNNDEGASSGPFTVQAADISTKPNSTVTVTFTFSNTNGSVLSGPAVEVTAYPSPWTIANHEDAGATYSDRSGTPTWLWLQVSDGDSKQPTMTFEIPNSTSPGEYSVTVEGQTADGTTKTDTATITVTERQQTKSIDVAIAGQDGTLSITEIQQAIRYWATASEVPDTGGKTIGIVKVQELIRTWASGGTVDES
ncbi:MAG: PKD domain-containing protein [Halobacteriales archaeon]